LSIKARREASSSEVHNLLLFLDFSGFEGDESLDSGDPLGNLEIFLDSFKSPEEGLSFFMMGFKVFSLFLASTIKLLAFHFIIEKSYPYL